MLIIVDKKNEIIKKKEGIFINTDKIVEVSEEIEPNEMYDFDPIRGPMLAEEAGDGIISGEGLLAIHNEDFTNKNILRQCRRLMRMVLSYHLGEKPLASREILEV